jgi:biopolymer transport protein ExbB/biopolymer transport protein TolQ
MNSNVVMQKLVLIAPLVARTVLYVLIALSVLSIGVIIERWWFFRRRRDDLAKLTDGVRKALARGDLAEARKLLASSPSIEAEIVGESMGWYSDGVDAVEQILVKATRVRRKKFEAGLLFLGTLGNNAPFIGLFGTVLGIVTAFRELGGNQMGAAMGNVMSGIAEALLATAVGILVALPAVIYYNVFQKKGADVEEGAAALGNVVIASMKAGAKPNGTSPAKKHTSIETSSNVVEMEA